MQLKLFIKKRLNCLFINLLITMEEQIAESVLLDVFDAIKGPFGK